MQASRRWTIGLLGTLFAGLIGLAACSGGEPARAAPPPDHVWPPQVGRPYPDLRLRTPQGDRVALSSLRGRVILVEPIGMDCPACNAFSGANRPGVGGFQRTRPQKGLPSVHEMLAERGVSLSDERLVYVQLLLYDTSRSKPPTLALARRWAQHFGLGSRENELLLVGEDYLIGPASFKMIPGLQLVDRDFTLRWDATGHRPRHDLWRELLPALPALLAEVEATPAVGS